MCMCYALRYVLDLCTIYVRRRLWKAASLTYDQPVIPHQRHRLLLHIHGPDLRQFDAEAVYLHLIVDAPNENELCAGLLQLLHHIARAVINHALAEGVEKKLIMREVERMQVSLSDADPADP